ncbi:N-terminal Xaa-Pro-Lys N-methyltransferase 1 [Daktulosphaira vitifoliae]|uniref:N-terminal Xaa-Pro-Lys N-methyltransferase 1 n=1 Tax=Daktulosphaira vitifoliae TaxID=58002 RepID=UPI0021AAD506|nr:N-terminal Xaa-Pro-Lys N-methyltransferase 1 [Daktulosphaira vitifoliae]
MDTFDINYNTSKNYWSNTPASLDGMLGGFAKLTIPDIKESNVFLKNLFKMKNGPSNLRALDCGAGIGRISKQLLTKHFTYVDLLEQDKKFVEKAQIILQGTNVVNFYCASLQDFSPNNNIKYDVIWIQWVLGYITNEDLIKFLKKCCMLLNKNGVIVIKENISSSEEGDVDAIDSSVTRSIDSFCNIYQEANLKCITRKTQQNFPKGMYKVETFALQPIIK